LLETGEKKQAWLPKKNRSGRKQKENKAKRKKMNKNKTLRKERDAKGELRSNY